ncbi:hypothetical protein [Commensalibacter oyaizuii]|uniref:Uncharacterized protein n=1 Tax=Commensalibacter oyaizuii TaxID=3043873 RepID=A0ABT6Q094_9PROT|nr:hypothetical protein [Commensalibacter sp. TBRC 16381]MDI2089909.1 hypothetical protein [Commensalibacter sp. TBRC 16381]
MKIFSLRQYYTSYLIPIGISVVLLTGCAARQHVLTLDRVQSEYTFAETLNKRYMHGFYGKPDPASFERLKQYRSDAYQALMQFRAEFDKNKPLPQAALQNAQTKIDIYTSYLNALGATSATKDTFTGF